MSGQQHNDDGTNFSRRTFMKTTGLLAAAGAAGAGVPSAAAQEGFSGEFANWRVREVQKVWDRGFRGRPDRAIGLTDSGIDARHPDLGPWNGIQATVDDGELVLTGPELGERTRSELEDEDVNRSGTAGPGTFATGNEVPTEPFNPPAAADELDAVLSWTPTEPANDLELRLDVKVGDDEWEEVATAATANEVERLNGVQIDPDETYRFVAEQYATVSCTFEIVGTFFKYEGSLGTYGDDAVFDEDGNLNSYLDTDELPKVIGWFNEVARYGDYDRPRDPNGHGSHCASIMGGTGQASQPDPDTVVEEEPNAVLTAGDTLEYEIEADAGSGVFISAYGDGIELIIEGPDGREQAAARVDVLTSDADTSEWDNNVAAAAADKDGTYTAYVRAAGGELASTGRVQKVSTGTFHDPIEDAPSGDRDASGETTLHAGVAPDASLVGLQGLSAPSISLGEYAGQFAELFNLRSVNMSWGYQGGLPLGGLGQDLDGGVVAAIKEAAQEGILTVAAAGNAATPANGNGAPAVADEAISVVSTGPLDGIVAYSSGGIGGNDEDGDGTYMKPDVTAPGGSATDSIDAADIGDANDDSLEYGDVRDYTAKSGTSMASPFTNGVAGLVAEAMEFGDGPEDLSIKPPADAGIEDVMKLKHVILSTASETAFTAAPYHRAHNPVYNHGGRDPYEGYGRVNPDAAVDAVTHELLDARDLGDNKSADASFSEEVGLGIPDDSRAVAGYVQTRGGSLDVSVEFSNYSGGNKAMAKEAPHLDLFVYNTEPGTNGEPNIAASAQGESGSASVTVTPDTAGANEDPKEHTYFVVAKLVNVPGAVNGYDVQANFELGLDFTAGDIPLPTFTADGDRDVDSSVVLGRQANTVRLTVTDLDDDAVIQDEFPPEWTLLKFGQGVEVEDGVVQFRTDRDISDPGPEDAKPVTTDEVEGEDTVTFTYFVEAPSGVQRSDLANYGPANALVVDDEDYENAEADFAGQDDVVLVGLDV